MDNVTLTLLQQYWWIIISVLGAKLVLLLFVQGGQTLIYTLGKTELERTMLINALGRKWEFTFTTLVVFGGAFFASFPLFYSTSFGGAYWLWMAILFCFIVQAISYEYRSKPNNFLGKRTYEVFLFINGFFGPILLGVAVATFFTGSDFMVNKMNLTNISNPIISAWGSHWHGLEAIAHLHNLLLGFAVFFLSRTLAILYFMNHLNQEQIFSRSRQQLLINGSAFVVFFLSFTIWLMLRHGFAVDPSSATVYLQKFKYFHNLVEMPHVLVLFLLGVVLVLWGIIKSLVWRYTKGIWFSGFGTVLTVFALFLIAGFNNTAYYPSISNLQSSLTIENSSSSRITLTVMTIVSIMMPGIIAYIWYSWRKLNLKKMDEDEMLGDNHIY